MRTRCSLQRIFGIVSVAGSLLMVFFILYANDLRVFRRISQPICSDLYNDTSAKSNETIIRVLTAPLTETTLLAELSSFARSPITSAIPRWSPAFCSAPISRRVALIVPYRNRAAHLRTFLRHMHPFLSAQLIQYEIFVVEQTANQTFNRGKLFNVGFDVVRRLMRERNNNDNSSMCYILHDVDLLPEDRRNLYACSGKRPRHLAREIDKFNYSLPYDAYFGGVSAVTEQQMIAMNGCSNCFWGWGGEDDEMGQRAAYAGFNYERYGGGIGRYKMLRHDRDRENSPPSSACTQWLLRQSPRRWKNDGLSDLHYRLVGDVIRRPLYTTFTVDLEERTSRSALKKIANFC